jgi:GNAT superfamily N-acetyltransferase
MGAGDRSRTQADDRGLRGGSEATSLRPPVRGGRLAALIETIPEVDHLLIENVAVAPPYQGRGLGRKLMAHAEELAASLGFGEIKLYTNKLFAENVRLYARLGYRVDREEEFKGGIVVHMSKPIGTSHRK